jgi:antitoxin component HigA of HigAB toxin-antitoxin module
MTKFIDGPLPLLISARIRLSDDQRQALKTAYYAAKNAADAEPPRIGGSTVRTTTAVQNMDLDKQLGMSSIVVADLLNSRDSLAIAIVLKLQTVLGVEVVTPEQLLDACKGYISYVFETYGK